MLAAIRKASKKKVRQKRPLFIQGRRWNGLLMLCDCLCIIQTVQTLVASSPFRCNEGVNQMHWQRACSANFLSLQYWRKNDSARCAFWNENINQTPHSLDIKRSGRTEEHTSELQSLMRS